MVRYAWGVDSSTTVTNELLECVKSNYGTPEFWGRYLTKVPNVSEGLTRAEVSLIKDNGIKILPIWNDFQEAVGYQKGRTAASNATFKAKIIGVKRGTIIFAYIEKFFEVDPEWIKGWVYGLSPSGFKSGFYIDPNRGNFNDAFCYAAQQDEKVREQSLIWSAEKEFGVTKKVQAPKFNPIKLNCPSNICIWQYGRNSQICPVNTNLADSRVLNDLW